MKVNKRITITISLLGGITLALVGAVCIPTILSIRQLQTNIGDENYKIEERYAMRRLTRNSLGQLEEIKRRIEPLREVGIQEGQELAFVNAMENAASSSNIDQKLSLETVNQRDISPWEKEVPLKITATGDYRDLIVYLRRVEKLPYYIVVKNLSISVPKNRTGLPVGTVQADINSVINWYSDEQPVFKKLNIAPSPDDQE